MDLKEISMVSGVNENAEPFVRVSAVSTDKKVMLAQLDPEDVRQHALKMLAAAEGAEQDAAVLRVVRKIGLPDEMAGAIVAELRDSRK